ncbi:unnamed protein product [Penicillium bialowiezense]
MSLPKLFSSPEIVHDSHKVLALLYGVAYHEIPCHTKAIATAKVFALPFRSNPQTPSYAIAFSLNYFVDEESMTVEDANSTLKVYEDKKSTSGNIVKTPKAPGKVFLKAALFDKISHPSTEVFANKQLEWVDLGATEKHA